MVLHGVIDVTLVASLVGSDSCVTHGSLRRRRRGDSKPSSMLVGDVKTVKLYHHTPYNESAGVCERRQETVDKLGVPRKYETHSAT